MDGRTWIRDLAAALLVVLALGGCGGGGDGGPPPVDTDRDGVADHLDPDDDNDGVADVEDPAPLDPDIPVEVDIPDPILRKVLESGSVLDKAPGAPIYAHELAALDDLSLYRGVGAEPVRSLEGLQHATALEFLNLSHQAVFDLSPLADLTALQTLILANNRIRDISPLAGLVNLYSLHLNSNPTLKDLTPLAGMTRLVHLYLQFCTISDVSPLAGLTELESLNLHYNLISDLSPLAGLTRLTELSVSGNHLVEDLSPLADMTGLTRLHAFALSMSDISPLAGMTKLTQLALGRWGYYAKERLPLDLSPLAGMTEMESLLVRRFDVSDLSPLAGMAGLTELYMTENRISDLSPLAGLGKLTKLYLSENRISDLSPLVANDGLGEGDRVVVPLNPLDAASLDRHAPDLRARGVDIVYDAFAVRPGDTPLIYNDNVFVLHAPVEGRLSEQDPQAIAREFYRHFEDAFDFLMVLPASYIDRSTGRFGHYIRVSNDVQGIGLPLDSDASRYGSEGRLKGIPVLFKYDGLSPAGGVAAHELLHQWGAYVVRTSDLAHWGFSSADGMHGGFDIKELVDHGGGRYSAGRFSRVGYLAHTQPYSPIELYLMGLAPPEEVPDLWVAEDGELALDEEGRVILADQGGYLFSAGKVRTYAIEDIIALRGPRVPAYPDAQRTFRAAAVLVIENGASVPEFWLREVSEDAVWFSHPGEGDVGGYWNFHDTTGGRATIEMDGLSRHNTREALPRRRGSGSARLPARGRPDWPAPRGAAPDAPTPMRLEALPETPHGHAGGTP